VSATCDRDPGVGATDVEQRVQDRDEPPLEGWRSIVSLTIRSTSAGERTAPARLRSVQRAIAVTAAAPAPLPHTSPITTAQWFDPTGNTS
jgi:hypothetical protein